MPPLAGSAAIDAGLETGNLPATDQRGFARVVGSAVDIGAVEAGNTVFSPVVNIAQDVMDGLITTNVSLREAIAYATNGSTITFAPSLSGQTLMLTDGQMVVEKNLTIDASVLPGGFSIDGNANSRILEFVSGTTNVIKALILTNGYSFPDIAFPLHGGGILLKDGVLTAFNCTISGNSSSHNGGGIYNDGGILALHECIIPGNSAWLGGGGIYNSDGTLTLHKTTVCSNSVSNGIGGAGIMNYGGSAAIYNSTLSSNQSLRYGGGIYNSGMLALNQSTIAGNYSFFPGGGIFNSGTLTITNTIVADNASTNSGNNVEDLGLFSGSNNLTNGAALLAPLGDYGGATPTMPPLPGSPAIDAGLDTGGLPATDQRGYPRLVGLALDIGAVEGIYNVAGPGIITDVTRLGDGSVQFTFTNVTGAVFPVIASTNVALPSSSWPQIGFASEDPVGSRQFPFVDTQATNYPQRYYRVKSP
jgi:hypothetical protein